MDSLNRSTSFAIPNRRFSKYLVHGTKYLRSSSYFSDKKRCIDFVLAYEPEQVDLLKDDDSDIDVSLKLLNFLL